MAIDWEALRRLRAKFLEPGEGGIADYWADERLLASYDATFAERIGWKWDAVLTGLCKRGWTPPEGRFLDWGCGTGVAGRRVVAAWPEACRALSLWDRSAAARRFALNRAREAFPKLEVREGEEPAPALLILSHVLNELPPAALERLLTLAESATALLWVEPGTAQASRRLIAVRERLLAAFRPIAPCPHAGKCGLLAPENASHWCHHFATPPAWVFQDSAWGRFARELEIDFGTVPFSYLVLDRRPGAAEPGLSRLIGRPRHAKGYARLLCCESDGRVGESILQKRDAAPLLKQLKKKPASLYRWEREGSKIHGGEAVA